MSVKSRDFIIGFFNYTLIIFFFSSSFIEYKVYSLFRFSQIIITQKKRYPDIYGKKILIPHRKESLLLNLIFAISS